MPYDNNMQMSLFKVVSDNPKAPALRVVFEINGTPYQCGLWLKTKQDGTKVVDKNGNGIYGGKIEVDTYAQQRQAPPQQPPQYPQSPAAPPQQQYPPQPAYAPPAAPPPQYPQPTYAEPPGPTDPGYINPATGEEIPF